MATKTHSGKHFAILQLGVSIWNQWRASEPLTVPDLCNADLSGLHLENVNLCRADLRNANLSKAYLFEADFQSADLRKANLTRAGLIGANLHRANLSGATVKQAYLAQSDLSNANLTNTYLQQADFQSALLTEAILKGAHIAEADFTASLDLTQAQIDGTQATHLACFDTALSSQLSSANVLESNPTEVFNLSIESLSPTQTVRDRLRYRLNQRFKHRLNASRNAAVANVGLS
jgi:uncharacterized protein YjbI with pentapeptide repeats